MIKNGEIVMNQVSGITDGKFYSAYFSVKYRPSEDGSNKDLNKKCVTLLANIIRTDINRSQRNVVNLQKSFLEAFNECKTQEEKQNFAKFLYELAKVGGYAAEFYKNNISLVTGEAKIDNVTSEAKKNKVSAKTDRGIESAYFNIKYRPKGSWTHNQGECSSLLLRMALADITRREYEINKVMQNFCEILSRCQTQDEFTDLAKFMNIISSVGGYAIEFNDKVKNMINPEGKLMAIQYLNNIKKQKQASTIDLEEFKKNFTRLNANLEEIRASAVIDDEEIALLLRKYNELQAYLHAYNGMIDKKIISRYDEQIEQSINYLKGLYKDLEELKENSVKF